jgi:hypothetical protein
MIDRDLQFAFKPTPEELLCLRALPIEQLPSITAVVPSYNQGEFVKETIRALRSLLRMVDPRMGRLRP